MLFCMRTTLNLDDGLMTAVKKAAADSGKTITEVVEEALTDALLRRPVEDAQSFELALPTVKGRSKPGVDLTDRESLFEIMEGRR